MDSLDELISPKSMKLRPMVGANSMYIGLLGDFDEFKVYGKTDIRYFEIQNNIFIELINSIINTINIIILLLLQYSYLFQDTIQVQKRNLLLLWQM